MKKYLELEKALVILKCVFDAQPTITAYPTQVPVLVFLVFFTTTTAFFDVPVFHAYIITAFSYSSLFTSFEHASFSAHFIILRENRCDQDFRLVSIVLTPPNDFEHHSDLCQLIQC